MVEDMKRFSTKPFGWQVGFVGPPCYFDASPTDFLRAAPGNFGVHGRAVRADVPTETAILDAALELASCGAELIAVVGSNWSKLGLESERTMRAARSRIEDTCGKKVLLALLSIIESLRNIGAKRIALNTSYSTPDWQKRLADFFAVSGFSVAYAGSFVDQGLISNYQNLEEHVGFFPRAMAEDSIDQVWAKAGDVDAIVVTGIPSFTDPQSGQTKRMAHLTETLGRRVPVPIICTDTALYQGIVEVLGPRGA
jgi:maleate cis-trans isomerase